MDIKVTIGLDEKTHDVLNRLIDAINAPVNAAAKITHGQDEEWTEEEKREALQQMYEEEAAQKGHKNAQNAKPATEEEVADDEENAPAGPISGDGTASKGAKKVTPEELRGLAADVKAKYGDASKVKALLGQFKVKNLSGLPEDKLGEFAAKLEELL